MRKKNKEIEGVIFRKLKGDVNVGGKGLLLMKLKRVRITKILELNYD
jgi:hypothetical protein